MDADGSSVRRLSSPLSIGDSPSFTPDGRILFVSQTRVVLNGRVDYRNRQIYVMNADGTHMRRLTSPPGESAFDSFSR